MLITIHRWWLTEQSNCWTANEGKCWFGLVITEDGKWHNWWNDGGVVGVCCTHARPLSNWITQLFSPCSSASCVFLALLFVTFICVGYLCTTGRQMCVNSSASCVNSFSCCVLVLYLRQKSAKTPAGSCNLLDSTRRFNSVIFPAGSQWESSVVYWLINTIFDDSFWKLIYCWGRLEHVEWWPFWESFSLRLLSSPATICIKNVQYAVKEIHQLNVGSSAINRRLTHDY